MTYHWRLATASPDDTPEYACICGPMQSDPEAIDERPDCPAHGVNRPYDPTVSDIGEVPF
jgi:hypothetical protein